MKVTLTIPESYKDITVGQYQRWINIVENNESSDFVNLKTVEIFCNAKNARFLPMHEVNNAITQIMKVFEVMPKHIQRFHLNGREFGFVPNLDDLTFGEYVDINTYIDSNEDFHKALAVLYRPITAKTKDLYEIEPYKGSDVYAGEMKDAPLDTILGAKVFFYDLASELLRVTHDYLQRMPAKEKEIIQHKLNSIKDGVGINPYMLWHKVMFSQFQRLQA